MTLSGAPKHVGNGARSCVVNHLWVSSPKRLVKRSAGLLSPGMWPTTTLFFLYVMHEMTPADVYVFATFCHRKNAREFDQTIIINMNCGEYL